MIRTVTILSVFLVIFYGVKAQEDGLQRVLSLEAQRVDRVDPQKEANTVIIPSSFSKDAVQRVTSKSSGDLLRVYYIYTGYRQSSGFDQEALNKQRITRLAEMVPEVLENRYIEWKIIEQTGCTSPQIGRTFFHGFVLEYRPPVSERERQQELQNLKAFLEDPNVGYRYENDPSVSNLSKQIRTSNSSNNTTNEAQTPQGEENQEPDVDAHYPEGNFALYEYFKDNIPGGGKIALNRDDLWVAFDMEVDENGKIGNITFKDEVKEYVQEVVFSVINEMPDWSPARKNGNSIPSKVNIDLRMSYSPIVRGMYKRDGQKPDFNKEEIAEAQAQMEEPDDAAKERINAAENSTVYRSMEAVIPKEKVCVVMDVTSSMSIHLASMNWWLVNSPDSLNIVHYTFFNDGDNAEDRKKKVGRTGGIYHGQKLRELPATLMEAMHKGNGGDVVENDFEALIAAQNQSQNADALLLIVDNFSDVRDEDLLPQISMKTHVIVAGDVTVVRECYLNLAKATGGDLLVNGKRLSLENVQPGGRVTIAESTYHYDGNNFRLL